MGEKETALPRFLKLIIPGYAGWHWRLPISTETSAFTLRTETTEYIDKCIRTTKRETNTEDINEHCCLQDCRE